MDGNKSLYVKFERLRVDTTINERLNLMLVTSKQISKKISDARKPLVRRTRKTRMF